MQLQAESPRCPVRVFLVDDHEIVRSGLKVLVEAQPDMSVVGEAAEGLAGLRGVAELAPDVVVMDLSMPVLGGVEATERIRATSPGVKVLALTAREERAYVDLLMAGDVARVRAQALRCGRSGAGHSGDRRGRPVAPHRDRPRARTRRNRRVRSGQMSPAPQ